MNNEPVAWMYRIKNTDNRWELAWNKPTTEKLFDTEPLYTHPVKELTDEKINELANQYLYVLNDIPYANDIKDFAKAILRKAQEK